MGNEAILVFNFGGQYCHLIARRIREEGVYSEIVSHDISMAEIKKLAGREDIKGIILSGGPSSIYEKGAPDIDNQILSMGLPVLGICYGHQLLAHKLGGKVVSSDKKEYGHVELFITKQKGLFKGLSGKEDVWMSHGDTVIEPPPGAEAEARTENCPVAAFSSKGKFFGIQWHAEVSHTRNGTRIIKNFIFDICKSKHQWKPNKSHRKYIDEIASATKGGSAIIALSGGVDSSTAAVLASKAIGKRLTAVFIDHGMMREGESEEIKQMASRMHLNLHTVEAGERFLDVLKGVKDPEEKRKKIGAQFIREFEREAREIGADYLIQGTIYPDRIESGASKKSSVIKTHHNVGGIPEDIEFSGIVEPLKDLYKDEVRELAAKLGMEKNIINRQPFPGPGFAVRIVGEVTADKIALLRKADKIVSEEIRDATGIKGIWQSFAVLSGIRSTGVKGDARAYGEVIAIRAVESTEAMTANFARLPYEALSKISARITNEIPEVVRVVYDITDKPPSTIEWE